MAAERFDFVNVEILDAEALLRADGTIDPLSFRNREFVVSIDPTTPSAVVQDWLATGAYVEVVSTQDGTLRTVAATRAELISPDGSGPRQARVNVTLSQTLGSGGASYSRLETPTFRIRGAVVAPEFDSLVICYSSSRPLLHVENKIRAPYKIVMVEEIDRVRRTRIRSIGLFDGWLWRSIDDYPPDFGHMFLTHVIFEPEDMVAFESSQPLHGMSFGSALLTHLGPKAFPPPVRVTRASFQDCWESLEDLELDDEIHRVRSRPNY